MQYRSGNIVVTIVVVVAIILLIVFGVTREAAAPTEDGVEEIEATEDAEGAEVKNVVKPVMEEKALECGQKNSECSTSDDCCGNLGLTCQDVRTSTGGFGKRCLPVEVQICRSDCVNGVWAAPRGCRAGVAPEAMQQCETFVGEECKESVNANRNDRECWNT